jgi:HSP20 family protein
MYKKTERVEALRKGGVIMTVKSTRDLVKSEKSRFLSPFEEMERWFEETWKRPFSLFYHPYRSGLELTELDEISPSVDIYEEEGHVVIKADIPGIEKKNLNVDITDNILTISGEKKKEEKVEKKDYHRYERTYGTFNRSFRLREGIDSDKVKARYMDGVLEIRFPKTKEVKAHKKTVSVE